MYSRFLETPEGSIHYRIKPGFTPPIALLHGTGGHCGSFEFLLDSLGQQKVILPDMRGHGDSFKPDSHYTTYEYAKDIYHLITNLGYEGIVLGGFSLGALVSLCIGISYPDLISSLILIEPSIGTKEEIMQQKIESFENIPESFKNEDAVKKYLSARYGDTDKDRYKIEIECGFIRKADGTYWWKYKKGAALSTFKNRKPIDAEIIGQMSFPVLIIRASSSEMFSAESYMRIKNLNKSNLKLITIEGCDHRILFQKPDRLKKEIISFLNG